MYVNTAYITEMSYTLTEVRLPLPHSIVVAVSMSLRVTCGANIVAQIMVRAYTSRDYDNVNPSRQDLSRYTNVPDLSRVTSRSIYEHRKK